jgi:RHS repeat-associated protein
MIEPGRKFVQGVKKYRYSINGQEKETELNENITTAEYWEYDSRLGRRWNVDPVSKEYESPYAAFANNPIWNIDPDGSDTAKSLSNSQLVDAAKIASNEVKNVIKNKGNLWDNKSQSNIVNAAWDYWEAHQNEMTLGSFGEFKSNVEAAYTGYATVAWWQGAESFNKIDKLLNSAFKDKSKLKFANQGVFDAYEGLWGIMREANKAAMFIAAASGGSGVNSKGPKGTKPRTPFVSNSVPLVEYKGGMSSIYRGLNGEKPLLNLEKLTINIQIKQ